MKFEGVENKIKQFVMVIFLSSAQSLPYHFGVNWPKICKNKDGAHFFALKFEWHNIRYNKLLLCNSENNDIAWCNKNN